MLLERVKILEWTRKKQRNKETLHEQADETLHCLTATELH
jgi:hypothetical protein